jgi:hypothetical protein
MMRLNKFARRVLRLSAFVVCIVVALIFGAAIFLRLSPAELIGRYVFLRSILLQKPAPMPPPGDLFRQHVLDPIPESVADIRADQPKRYGGYRYTLRFNINRSDVALLINSGALKRVWNVKYKNGYLFWAWDTWNGYSLNGVDIIVYHPDDPPGPSWFKPELWENPEAYAFREKVDGRTNTKVLLFNEKEGEAYFIVGSME